MPAITDHEAFTQPADPSTRIWRYIDIAKLISLLETRSLYFPRIDQLADPFEGSLSRAEWERWRDFAANEEAGIGLPDHLRGRYFDFLMNNARRARRSVYVSCWHLNNGESEAMWQLYARSGYGIALRSTYASLVAALPGGELHNGCFAGIVRYTDYDNERMPEGNIFYPVTHKRRAFEHEREMRAVIWYGDRGWEEDPDQADNPRGLSIRVDLDSFIDTVFVSPTAPDWFAAAVTAVVRKYGSSFGVVQSDLARPAYL